MRSCKVSVTPDQEQALAREDRRGVVHVVFLDTEPLPGLTCAQGIDIVRRSTDRFPHHPRECRRETLTEGGRRIQQSRTWHHH